MMQLTKENSAILAAWEGFDDSSSESSIGSNDDDESHCFEDTDDDGDYRPPALRQSSARNLRRASGIFTPAPFLASTLPDPMPPSSHEVMLEIGGVSRICIMAAQEEQALLLKETELRSLECDSERLKQMHTQKERAAVVRTRYSTHLLQTVSPFELVDTDGVVSYLAFPTPVQGLDVAAAHTMDRPLIIDSEDASRGSSTASSGIDTRFDQAHPCSTFYFSLLNACLQNVSEFSLASGMSSLLTLEFLLGRLEDAFWDVHHLYSKTPNTTIDAHINDGTTFVVVRASANFDTTLRAVYDCSDFRTLYSCRPTFAQLDDPDDMSPTSWSYPQESLIVLMDELMGRGSADDCKTL
jgi:hypothetical protein